MSLSFTDRRSLTETELTRWKLVLTRGGADSSLDAGLLAPMLQRALDLFLYLLHHRHNGTDWLAVYEVLKKDAVLPV